MAFRSQRLPGVLTLALLLLRTTLCCAEVEKPPSVPQDAAVLEVTVPSGTQVFVDDDDQGERRRFEFHSLRPAEYRLLEVKVRFRDGEEEKRSVLLQGGWHVALSLGLTPATRPEPVVQLGHTDSVSMLAFSEDGKLILTAGNDNAAILWQTATGNTLCVFRGTGSLASAALSPNGKEVLTGYKDGSAILWDATTGKPRQVLKGHTERVHAVAFSPDGQQALTGSEDKTAILWDVPTGDRLHTFHGHTDVISSVAFGVEGKQVLTGSYDGSAFLWDVATGQKLQAYVLGVNENYIRSFMVTSVAISPGGKQILTGCQDGAVVLWDTTTEARLQTLSGHRGEVGAVAFRRGGKQAVTGSADGTAVLWDLRSGQKVRTYGKEDRLSSVPVACSPDGNTVLTGVEKKAVLWDTDSGKEVRSFVGHTGQYTTTDFSRDGKWLLSGGDRAVVRESATGREVNHLEERTRAFSPDGSRLLSASGETATVWDVNTGKRLCDLPGHGKYLRCGAFNSDGSQVLTGADDCIARLWEVDTGKQLCVLVGHTGGIHDLAFSPDGSRVVTASSDATAILWDAASGRKIKVLKKHTHTIDSAAFDPEGKHVLTGSWDGRAILWDAQTGARVREFRGTGGNVFAVAFSPDGRRLLTGSADHLAHLWDVETGTQLRVFRGHTEAVEGVHFAPDGRHLWTTSTDYTTRWWDAATGEELAEVFNLNGGRDWLVVTPEGLFDGSVGGRQKVAYRLGGAFSVAPVDRFFQDFYRPGLLASLWRGERPLPEVDLGSQRPPALRILSPTSGESVETSVVTLEVVAVDQGGGVQGPWLFHNGARVLAPGTASRTGQTVRRRFTVSLVEGDNRLEVKAASSDGGWESEPVILGLRYEKPLDRPELYVVVVGINDYAEESLHLKFAAADAQALADLFDSRGRALYREVHVQSLLNERATRDNIQRAFAEIRRKAQPQDTLLVFLAGHGTMVGQRYYFIPHEFGRSEGATLEEDVRKQGLAHDVLADDVAAVPALKRVLLFDTCASGGAVGLTRTTRNPFALRGAIERLAHDQGIYTLAAAASSEEAHEVPELGHGVLTYALLAGLHAVEQGPLADDWVHPNTPDGVVDVLEWFAFAAGRVPRLTKKYFGREQEVVPRTEGNSFPVLPVRNP